MEEKKNIGFTRISIPMLVIVLFSIKAYTTMGVNFFIPFYNSHERLFFIVSSMVLILYLLMVGKKVYLDSITFMGVILIVLPLIWNNYDFKNGEYFGCYSFAIVIVFFLLFRTNKSLNWKKLFAWISVGTSMFYSFFTVATFLSPALYKVLYKTLESHSVYDLMEFYELGYMAGITAHYTTNGIYLMSGVIPLGLMLFCTRGSLFGKKRLIVLIAFIFNVLALLLSGKRAHTIFTLIAFIIVVYLFNSDRPKGRFIKLLVCISMGFALIILVANFVPEVLNVINRFVESQEETGTILNGRDGLQVDIYNAISESPLFGKGWAWYPWNNSYSRGTSCHNVYLQLFGEIGIFGSIFFLAFFANMLFRSVMLALNSRRGVIELSLDEQFLVLMSIGYQIYFLLYCTTGNPLYGINCYFPYFTWCAIHESIMYDGIYLKER